MRTPIHAIVFRLPFVENVYNVASRRHHEGNFEGTSDVHRQIIYGTRSRLFDRGHPRYILNRNIDRDLIVLGTTTKVSIRCSSVNRMMIMHSRFDNG